MSACGQPGAKHGMLPIGPSGYCQRHDPNQAGARSRQASGAAQKSHEWEPPKDFKAWVMSLDLTTAEGRARAATETAQKALEEIISVGQANSVAGLIRAAEGKPSTALARPSGPVGVTLRYGRRTGAQPARELHLVDDTADGEAPA